MLSKRTRWCFAVYLAGLVLAAAISIRASSPEQSKASQASESNVGGEYAGSEICIICHADQNKHFQSTAMGKAFAHPKNEKEKLVCEACHGPGKAHVEAGGGKETIPIRFTKDSRNSVDEKNGSCLSCHERGNRLFWQGSPHETRNIACVDCHTGHEPQSIKLSSDARFNAPLTDVHG